MNDATIAWNVSVCTDPTYARVDPCICVHESDTPNPELCGWDNYGSSVSSVADLPMTICRRESHNDLRSFIRDHSPEIILQEPQARSGVHL